MQVGDSFWVYGFCLGKPASVHSEQLARGVSRVVVSSVGDRGKVTCDISPVILDT